jgi:hypothetical protein
MLSDNHHSDWVKNLRKTPEVTVRIAERTFEGRARVVGEEREDELAGGYWSRNTRIPRVAYRTGAARRCRRCGSRRVAEATQNL